MERDDFINWFETEYNQLLQDNTITTTDNGHTYTIKLTTNNILMRTLNSIIGDRAEVSQDTAKTIKQDIQNKLQNTDLTVEQTNVGNVISLHVTNN